MTQPARMNKREIEVMMRAIAPVLREYITDRLAPLLKRIEEIEQRGVDYKGVWQRASSYRRGDVVTVDGSLWICTRAAEQGEAPGESMAWQLAVKRGRDGKDAR